MGKKKDREEERMSKREKASKENKAWLQERGE
jgi:hypothetical protein